MADMFATLEQTTRLVDEGNPDEAYRVMKSAVTEDSHGFARIFLSEWMKHLEGEAEDIQNKFAEVLLCLREDFPELPLTVADKPAEVMPTFSSSAQAMPLWLAPLEKPILEPTKQESPQLVESVAAKAEAAAAAESPVVETVVDKPAVTVNEPVDKPVEAEVKPQVEPQPVKRGKAVKPEEVGTENLTLTFYEWQMSAIHRAAMKEHVDENTLLSRMLETRKLEPLMWSRYKHGKTTSPAHRITIAVPHKTKLTIEKDKDNEGIKTTTKYVRKILFGARAEKA